MESRKQGPPRALIGAVLALVTIAVFRQVIQHDFINYDDPEYVTENARVSSGLALDNVVWAFTHSHAGNWHPLTWMAHMLDCQLFGMNAGAHHAVSLLIHIANLLLLFRFLNRLTGAVWRSAVVAGLFALHPLHVESVAWVAERKDVLSALFGLLSLNAYVRHAQRLPAPGARPWTGGFGLALLFFACSLMAKPMLVTLPFLLLLLDWWPLRRVAGHTGTGPGTALRRLILEKWPWFVLSAASCVVTFCAQKHSGAVVAVAQFPFGARLANALIAYVRYLGKTLCPVDLAVIYPRPAAWPPGWVMGAALILILISAAAVREAKRRPYLLFGWLWFLATLVPVIGLVQVGRQALADRYTYVPLIGLFVAAVWSAADLAAAFKVPKLAAAFPAAAVLLFCAFASAHQLGYWKNSLALFGRALAVTTDNAPAQNDFATALAALGRREEALPHYAEAARLDPEDALIQDNYGTALARAGQSDGAIAHYREAIRLEPNYAEPHNNLGTVLAAQGRMDEAMTQFNRALSIHPDYAEAHNNLAGALVLQNQLAPAVAHYQEALRLKPGDAGIHLNLGLSLAKLGRRDEAIVQLSEAVRIDPGAVESRYQLGRWLLMRGPPEPAVAQFLEVLRLKPEHAQARFYLGLAWLELQNTEAALAQLREAARLRPNWAEPRNVLAWILATQADPQVRNGTEAVRLAEQAVGLTGRRNPIMLHTLAAAYAEAGRFDEAVDTANQALDLARTSGQTNLVAQIQAGLDCYQARRPFRPPPPRR